MRRRLSRRRRAGAPAWAPRREPAGARVEQPFELGGRHGAREQVALPVVAAEGAQCRLLRRLLDPLGDRLQAQGTRHVHHRAGERRGGRLLGDAVDEGHAQLEHVHRVAAQVGDRGVAVAEVVDGHAHAEARVARRAARARARAARRSPSR
jgi:hypothetical protein